MDLYEGLLGTDLNTVLQRLFIWWHG